MNGLEDEILLNGICYVPICVCYIMKYLVFEHVVSTISFLSYSWIAVSPMLYGPEQYLLFELTCMKCNHTFVISTINTYKSRAF
jgi:hypothetical protein